MPSLFRHLAVIAAVLIGAFYAYIALTGPKGISAISASHTEVQKMEREIERLQLEIRRHEEFVRKLETDPELRDRVIRQRLEKQKPGETTIYDTSEVPQSPAAPIR